MTSRVDRLKQKLDAAGLDGLLLSNLDNLRYIGGYTGHAAHILVCAKGQFIVTDYRYAEIAQNDCKGFEVIVRNRVTTTLPEQLNRLFTDCGLKRVGFEAGVVSMNEAQSWQKGMSRAELVAADGLVEQLRYVKDQAEIEALRRAAKIADDALARVLKGVLKVGVTERDVALELEYLMQKAGSEGMSFETIILAGARSSLPHGAPSARKIENGDFVLFDFGAVQDGYGSDMTRTVVVGDADPKQIEVYDLVQRAQQVGLDAVRAGISGKEPYDRVREVLDASPYAKYAGEGLGHGVGLFLHEQPFMGANCERTLQENCVVTVEPGIYIPGWGGVRIEDDVIVKPDGCEIITHSPKELLRI